MSSLARSLRRAASSPPSSAAVPALLRLCSSSSFERHSAASPAVAWKPAATPGARSADKASRDGGGSGSSSAAAVDWPRPSEIPFQAKVANSVTLIGRIRLPVQSRNGPDGKLWAGTVVTRDESPDSPSLWIPITFEGDLAHVAASHLRENDHVCIAGQLSTNPPPLDVNQGQTKVQVMVHSINFVEGSSQLKKSSVSHRNEKSTGSCAVTQKYEEGPWKDLIDNPTDWWDNRDNKHRGLVSPKYPDFKRKDGAVALWLGKAPKWVLPKIEGLQIDAQFCGAKIAKEQNGDDAWKSLLENPEKWWDNRSNKLKEKSPDFRHKETRQGLWLDGLPSWVLAKLPPIKAHEGVAPNKSNNVLS
ncbi:protein OSB2, chloroplastic [Eucalyptus grandis]|uniref:protein OSB2, chloroplastic n=1 Tax=Eucalyptus grandis TaxID=71139 RepID=UPI00192EE809|nr:protein OSB2, chloroplastic [Eucalyptus grandis]